MFIPRVREYYFPKKFKSQILELKNSSYLWKKHVENVNNYNKDYIVDLDYKTYLTKASSSLGRLLSPM